MMNTRIHQSLVALTLLAGAAAGAQAEGLYVGGALSAPNYRDTINGVGGGNGGNGPGLKLYGGYQFTPNFALEGGYFNLGRSSYNNSGTAKAHGVYLDGVGTYSFAPNWSVLGSVGVAEGPLKTTAGEDNSAALKLGLGLQYDLTKTTALRLGYDQYRYTNAFDGKPSVGQTVFGLKVGF